MRRQKQVVIISVLILKSPFVEIVLILIKKQHTPVKNVASFSSDRQKEHDLRHYHMDEKMAHVKLR